MDFVEGRVLEDERLEEESVESRAALYDHMNEIMAELHRLDYEALGLANHGKRGQFAQRQIKTWSRQFRLGEPVVRQHQAQDRHAPAVVKAGARLEELITHLESLAGSVND